MKHFLNKHWEAIFIFSIMTPMALLMFFCLFAEEPQKENVLDRLEGMVCGELFCYEPETGGFFDKEMLLQN
jgi:hypothetical protein